jgi:hypothetical protein
MGITWQQLYMGPGRWAKVRMIKVHPGQGVMGTSPPTPMGIPPGGMSMSRFGVRGCPELGICSPLYGAHACRHACPPVGDRHPYGWLYTPPCHRVPGSSLASRLGGELHTPHPPPRITYIMRCPQWVLCGVMPELCMINCDIQPDPKSP